MDAIQIMSLTKYYGKARGIIDLSLSVLRRRILAPYVPLRTRCSKSVPVTDRLLSISSTLRIEFRNRLDITYREKEKRL